MRPLPHEALAQHREELKELAAGYGLSNLRVFGSAQQGTDTARSDLDLLVTRSPDVGLLTLAEFASAAESLIIKIAENVAQLSEATRTTNPQVPWSSIKRMRDQLAHHYAATDYDAVWATLIADLPRVRAAVASVLAGVSDH